MRLPTVGPKTAQRLAFFIIQAPLDLAEGLSQAILEARSRVRHCGVCYNLSDQELCAVCADKQRDRSRVCVVADSRDIAALERAREYKGLYHVLGGVIAPLEGIGPEHLRIAELQERLRDGTVKEVILATSPNVSGETTALYLSNVLRSSGVRVTRLAYGLPAGADLEYVDEVTLARALAGRSEMRESS